MSVDTETHGENEEAAVHRPPAVGGRLWMLIPVQRRKEYRVEAALGLRRGVHPETTIRKLLLADGGDPAAVRAALEDALEAPSEMVSPPPSPTSVPRAPLWPYGHGGPAVGNLPISEIGSRLQRELAMDPGAAASAEWKILRAIAKDPSWVENHPDDLRILGCDVPRAILHVVRDLIEFECRCVLEDVRSRRRAGDRVAMRWLDPASWA